MLPWCRAAPLSCEPHTVVACSVALRPAARLGRLPAVQPGTALAWPLLVVVVSVCAAAPQLVAAAAAFCSSSSICCACGASVRPERSMRGQQGG